MGPLRPALRGHAHHPAIDPPSTEGSAGTVELAATMQVSKNDELFIKNEELCVKNEEFCIKCRRWQRPW